MLLGTSQLTLDQPKKRLAIFQATEGKIGRQLQFVYLETRVIRVAIDLEGIVRRSKKSRVLTGQLNYVVHDVWQSHMAGQVRPGGQQAAQGRTHSRESYWDRHSAIPGRP